MRRAILVALACAPLAAIAAPGYDEAEVVDVEPIIETVARIEPKRRCWSEAVARPSRGESSAKPLLGAIIGGAVGNALGHNKRNKQVGAVVGALLGGAIATDAARRTRAPAGERQVCDTVEHIKRVERTAGYMVTYRYRGETYRARMDERPGPTIRVRVSVSPA